MGSRKQGKACFSKLQGLGPWSMFNGSAGVGYIL